MINYCLSSSQSLQRKENRIGQLEKTIDICEHQMRHSLSAINLFAENLHLGLSHHPLQEQAECIKHKVSYVQNFLNQKIAEINNHKIQFSSQCISILVENIWQDLSLIYQEKKLQLKLNSEPVLVWIDKWQIEQVIENIFVNAIEFSPTESEITCQWYLFPREILVEIIDQGNGFSADALANGLNLYFSERMNGKGLGLAIALNIVEAHGGNLWLENSQAQGAKVCFTLPRCLR